MAAANPPINVAYPGARAPALPRAGWLGLEYKWLVLIAMLPGFTVFLLDVTIVNVALARLGAVFDVNYATVQWVITGYSLASGMATPMASFLEQRNNLVRLLVQDHGATSSVRADDPRRLYTSRGCHAGVQRRRA